MEHREPPRTRSEDPDSTSAAPASPRALEAPRLRIHRMVPLRIDRTRAWIAAALVIAALFGLYLSYRAKCAAEAWLADQSAYQIQFSSIVLDPPPPGWYCGGTARYLEQVRQFSGMPEKFSLLKLREEELKHAFEHGPWTEEVLRVIYRPLGVTVRLAYHRPVALVEVSAQERYLIDESAIILPLEDLACDWDGFASREPLITINGVGLAGPQNPKPGIRWEARAGTREVAPGNGRIRDAARLARFLAEKLRGLPREGNTNLRFLNINPMDDDDAYRGLFLWNREEKIYVLWGEAPGQEESGNLSAEEKWQKMYEWSRSARTRTLPDGRFWRIARSGLVPDGTERRSPRAARTGPPRRDLGTILTKDPGQRP